MKFSCLAILLWASAMPAAAVTLYNEDFAGQNGRGFNGSRPSLDGVTWTLDPGATLFQPLVEQMRVSGEIFYFRNTKAGCLSLDCMGQDGQPLPANLPIWSSPVIDTSLHTKLKLTFDLFASTTARYERSGGINREDDLIVSVLRDDQPTTIYDFVRGPELKSISFTAFPSDADRLQIRVTGNSDHPSERLGFDNILLTGELRPVPLPAGFLLMAASLICLTTLHSRPS